MSTSEPQRSHKDNENISELRHLRQVRGAFIGQLIRQINEGVELMKTFGNEDRIMELVDKVECTLEKIHNAHLNYSKEIEIVEKIYKESAVYTSQEFRVVEFKNSAHRYIKETKESQRHTHRRSKRSSSLQELSSKISAHGSITSTRENMSDRTDICEVIESEQERTLLELKERRRELDEEIERNERVLNSSRRLTQHNRTSAAYLAIVPTENKCPITKEDLMFFDQDQQSVKSQHHIAKNNPKQHTNRPSNKSVSCLHARKTHREQVGFITQ